MNELNQISPFELAALMKILNGILGLMLTFLVMGVIALFKMNRNVSKLFTSIQLHDLKHKHTDENFAEIKTRLTALEK